MAKNEFKESVKITPEFLELCKVSFFTEIKKENPNFVIGQLSTSTFDGMIEGIKEVIRIAKTSK